MKLKIWISTREIFFFWGFLFHLQQKIWWKVTWTLNTYVCSFGRSFVCFCSGDVQWPWIIFWNRFNCSLVGVIHRVRNKSTNTHRERRMCAYILIALLFAYYYYCMNSFIYCYHLIFESNDFDAFSSHHSHTHTCNVCASVVCVCYGRRRCSSGVHFII